jgi:hypothetical protein
MQASPKLQDELHQMRWSEKVRFDCGFSPDYADLLCHGSPQSTGLKTHHLPLPAAAPPS